MSGIGSVLSTAKLAIAAQENSLSVTGHNIANVNSEYYSRQNPVLTPKDPLPYGTFWIGTGVELSGVQRSVDQLLENRLMGVKSELTSSEEMVAYMDIFEAALNENSESGLSNLMSEFFNSWQALSNNPTGSPDRVTVYEKGLENADRFNILKSDINQIEDDLNNEISAVIVEINSLASQIATLNNELLGLDVNNVSHDLMDRRNGLVSQLSELIDVNSFEQPNAALSVTTCGGLDLVNNCTAYEISIESGRIYWEGSYGGQIDMTDLVTGGKINGWLDMRDEVIAKSQAELNALAKEFIWATNYQHSQGIGLDYFDSAVTGTYATDTSGMLATLAFGDKIDYTEDFRMWIEDASGAPVTYSSVTVDMGISTADPTYTALDTFNQASSTYTITVTDITGSGEAGVDDIEFTWSETGGGSGTVNMNAATTVNIDGMDLTFNAGEFLVAGNTLKINTDVTGEDVAVSLTPTGTANSILDTYKFDVTSGGTVGTDTITVEWSNSVTTGSFTLDAATTTATVDGMTLTFAAGGRFATDDVFTVATGSTGSPTANMMSGWHWTTDSFADQFNTQATGVTASVSSERKLVFTPGADYSFGFSDDGFTDSGLMAALGINTFFSGYDAQTIGINSVLVDNNHIAAATIDAATGEFGVSDNSNALDISDLKFSTRSIAGWTYSRGSDATSKVINYTLHEYYHATVGFMSVKSAGVHRAVEFNASLVDKLTEQRDNMSAVSLDEEMINMMRYQHAYTVASKLMSVADEMLITLINSKS